MFVIYNSFISVGSCLIYISNLFLMRIKTIFSIACFFFPGRSVLFRSVQTAQHWNFRTALWRSRSKASRFGWLEGKLYPVFLQTVFLYYFHVLPQFLHFGNTESSGFSDSVFKISLFENSLRSLLWFQIPPLKLIVDWKVLRKGI